MKQLAPCPPPQKKTNESDNLKVIRGGSKYRTTPPLSLVSRVTKRTLRLLQNPFRETRISRRNTKKNTYSLPDFEKHVGVSLSRNPFSVAAKGNQPESCCAILGVRFLTTQHTFFLQQTRRQHGGDALGLEDEAVAARVELWVPPGNSQDPPEWAPFITLPCIVSRRRGRR